MNYRLGKFLRFFIEKIIHLMEPRAVLDEQKFSWAKIVESYHFQIKIEAQNVLENVSSIANFNEVVPGQRALHQDHQWKSFFLIGLGEDIPNHQKQCSQTTKALREIPGIINAFYSILAPGVSIPPHRGPYAGILRYHLGIIIPEGDVGIKVNGEVCRWKEGKSLFFDDSFTHEAWNNTNAQRVILFVDLERPLPPFISFLNRLVLYTFKASKAAQNARDMVFKTQIEF